MTQGNTNAEKAKWEVLRTTPRGRGLVKSIVVNQPRSYSSAKPNPFRAKKRQSARDAFRLGILRNKELGINPVYIGGNDTLRVFRGSPEHKAWLAAAKDWDKAHKA